MTQLWASTQSLRNTASVWIFTGSKCCGVNKYGVPGSDHQNKEIIVMESTQLVAKRAFPIHATPCSPAVVQQPELYLYVDSESRQRKCFIHGPCCCLTFSFTACFSKCVCVCVSPCCIMMSDLFWLTALHTPVVPNDMRHVPTSSCSVFRTRCVLNPAQTLDCSG